MGETLSINDFSRLDLRVGRITEVADHPNADKLYVMQCDLGPDLGTRQMVAGLKPYMPPEALKDQLVVVVANLEPATLRGQRSEGMLLAAQDGQKVVILTTAEDVATGSKIR
jgi:methionyl-tRNA synthetase